MNNMIYLHGGSLWIYLLFFFLMMVLPTIIIFIFLKKLIFDKHIKKQESKYTRLFSYVFVFFLSVGIMLIINYSLQNVW